MVDNQNMCPNMQMDFRLNSDCLGPIYCDFFFNSLKNRNLNPRPTKVFLLHILQERVTITPSGNPLLSTPHS